MNPLRLKFGLLLLAALAPAVVAQTPGEVCPGLDQALPGAFSGWRTAPLLSEPVVPVGRAVRVRLARGASATFGATLAVRIDRAGRYEVALSEPAWIDLVRNGETLSSVAHRHGPLCSTIRKIVSFDLVPGTYTLRLTHSPAAAATLAILAV